LDCSDKRSEISCSQIIKAYHIIKNYEITIKKSKENPKYLIQNPVSCGQGNQLMLHAFCLLLSIISNRTLILIPTSSDRSNYIMEDLFDHPSVVLTSSESVSNQSFLWDPWMNSLNFDNFSKDNVLSMIRSDEVVVKIDSVYPINFLYANEEIGKIAFDYFGFHAGYFLSNWVDRLKKETLNSALSLFGKYPKNIPILGLHIRVQYAPKFMYVESERKAFKVFSMFIEGFLNKTNGMIAFASDYDSLVNQAKEKYFNKIIISDVERIPDRNNKPALIDFAMLMNCNEFVGTYRSTFSEMVHIRTGIRPYYAEKRAASVFLASNSQSTTFSIVMQNETKHLWTTNNIFHLKQSDFFIQKKYFTELLL
jgi:hypothetical protein